MGLAESRDKAKRTIMAGLVTVDGRIEDKAGQRFDTEQEFAVKQKLCNYVSRGGLKLEKAISSFDICLKGFTCMDMGASTGGFTDCMLQSGAVKVYAVDVGYGQLDYRLRTDQRVVNMEKTNIRYMDVSLINEPLDFISIDVSFISLSRMFPIVRQLLSKEGTGVCLIKPQFEAGREQVGKNGIVRERAIHREVIEKVIGFAQENGLRAAGLDFSPVKGAKGNIEYLMYFTNAADEDEDMLNEQNNAVRSVISSVVDEAHDGLDK